MCVITVSFGTIFYVREKHLFPLVGMKYALWSLHYDFSCLDISQEFNVKIAQPID
ncbi:hypothetical protein LguiB_012663 [Lonicera macranthoides]